MHDKLEKIFFKMNNKVLTVAEATEALIEILNIYKPTSLEIHAYESQVKPESRPTNNGAVAIANALRKYSGSIDSLALTSCNIGDEGITAIAEALPYTKIRLLDLSSNTSENEFTTSYLSSDSVVTIAKVLARTQITELNLSYNHISGDSLITVAQELPKTQITSLNFHNCHITENCAHSFLGAIIKHPKLLHLDLSCDFHEDDDPCQDLIETINHQLKMRREGLADQITTLLFQRMLPTEIEESLFNLLPDLVFYTILELSIKPHKLNSRDRKHFEDTVQRNIDTQSRNRSLTKVPENFHVRNRSHFFQETPNPDRRRHPVAVQSETIRNAQFENNQVKQ